MSRHSTYKGLRRQSWLVGIWGREGSNVRYEITKRKNEVKIHSYDVHDEEVAIVSDPHWDGRAINFKLFWRSTRYKTIDRLRPLSKIRAVNTFTHWETWVKIGPWLIEKDDPLPRFGDPRKKRYWISGNWIDPEWWCRDILSIYRPKNSRFRIDFGGIKISKVKWNGTTLYFTTHEGNYKPKYLCYADHEFKPISHTRAEHAITEDWIYHRYD